MAMLIVLTEDNTIVRDDKGANVQATIHLENIWNQLKKSPRFLITTRLVVPITKGSIPSTIDVTLRNTYDINDVIMADTSIIVIQNAYIEGVITDYSKINASSSVWPYELNQVTT